MEEGPRDGVELAGPALWPASTGNWEAAKWREERPRWEMATGCNYAGGGGGLERERERGAAPRVARVERLPMSDVSQ